MMKMMMMMMIMVIFNGIMGCSKDCYKVGGDCAGGFGGEVDGLGLRVN